MIVQVFAYDPDYFKSNTLVFSEQQMDRTHSTYVTAPPSWMLFKPQGVNKTGSTYSVSNPNIRAAFVTRTLNFPISPVMTPTYGIITAVATALTPTARYPAQDNPIVTINATAFDLSTPSDQYPPAAPFIG